MLAFLQYLLALIIATPDPSGGASRSMPHWTAIVVTIAVFGLVWTTWGLIAARRVPGPRERDVPRHLRTIDAGRVTALAVFWLITKQMGGVQIPASFGVAGWVLVPHALRLLPFALLLALLRAGLHPGGARLELEPPGLPATLRAEFGQAVLPVAPLIPILLIWDLIFGAGFRADPASTFGAGVRVFSQMHVAQAALMLGLLFVVLALMPFALRFFWRARPLPEGALRTRLEAYAHRVGLRARDILVTPTDGSQINAFVAGVVPGLQYVFVTDGLIDTLGHDEIEAVFAHESGHARRYHMQLFFGFTAVLMVPSILPNAFGVPALAEMDAGLRTMVLVLIWFGVIFGWVSRRFEQEADVFGIDTTPFPPGPDGTPRDPAEHPFARALERIAAEVGGIRELNGWKHFSIAVRVAYVHEYVTHESVRRQFRRSILLLRATLLAVIGGAVAIAIAQVPKEIQSARKLWSEVRQQTEPPTQKEIDSRLLQSLRRATTPGPPAVRAQALLECAALARLSGDDDRGLRWLRGAHAIAPQDPQVMVLYAQALADAGKPRGAALVWRDLLAHEDLSESVRARVEETLESLPGAGD